MILLIGFLSWLGKFSCLLRSSGLRCLWVGLDPLAGCSYFEEGDIIRILDLYPIFWELVDDCFWVNRVDEAWAINLCYCCGLKMTLLVVIVRLVASWPKSKFVGLTYVGFFVVLWIQLLMIYWLSSNLSALLLLFTKSSSIVILKLSKLLIMGWELF